MSDTLLIIASLGGIIVLLFGWQMNAMNSLKKDITELREETHSSIAALRDEMHSSIAALREDMNSSNEVMRTDMNTSIAALRDEMHSSNEAMREDISELRKDISGLAERVARIEGMLVGPLTHLGLAPRFSEEQPREVGQV